MSEKITLKEKEKEVQYLTSIGLTIEEINGMYELFDIRVIKDKPKSIRVLNSGRKQK